MAEKIDRGVYTVHWSDILAGSFVALGVWAFLYALGAAIGMAGAERGPTTWTALYTLVAPIIAFFLGGLTISRSPVIDKADGARHGAIMWGFGTVIGGLLLGTLGTAVLVGTQTPANLPAGYMWAVAGSILGSLVAAVLGASSVGTRRSVSEKREVPVGTRREVYP
jgi:hypothetical protein